MEIYKQKKLVTLLLKNNSARTGLIYDGNPNHLPVYIKKYEWVPLLMDFIYIKKEANILNWKKVQISQSVALN
jgi:hypothetical protein